MSRRQAPPAQDPAGGAWDPLRDLITLKERLNRLFENVMRKGDFGEGEPGGWTPLADLSEDDESYRLTVELPGVRREDINIRLEAGVLSLEGHRPSDEDSRRAGHLRVERSHGPFARSFHLPGPVDEGGIRARFGTGLLEVVLPKAPRAPSGPVRIRVA